MAAPAPIAGPSRRKAATTSTQQRSSSSRTTTVTSAACPHCQTIVKASDEGPNTPSMLCAPCVRYRIARYVDHLIKIRADTKSARDRVEALLGGGGDGVEEGIAIPDPFGPPSDLPRNPHPTASHAARNTRAQWASLTDTIATRQAQIMTSEQDLVGLRRRIAKKRHDLAERRKRLGQAWGIVESQSELRGVEQGVQSLRGEMRAVGEELQRARRKKAKALLDIFAVSPPRKQPQWRQHRHVPGAFPANPAPRYTQPAPTHDWTIAALRVPLPTPSDLARLPREEINASVAYTARLLWLLSDLFGVALPFSVGLVDKGKWACQVDPLLYYDESRKGVGPTSLLPRKDTIYSLHLGKTAYSSMVASRESPSPQPDSPMDSSIVSLGMSTLTSAMESFVRVGSERTVATTSTSTSPTLQDYRLALTMLSYDASYLSWTQGVRTSNSAGTMDLLSTAGSILAILHDLCTTTTTSARPRSHVGLLPSANALDEGFMEWRVEVEFGKLVQLHGIGEARRVSSASKEQQQDKGRRVDESYVDAERDARSVVLRDRAGAAGGATQAQAQAQRQHKEVKITPTPTSTPTPTRRQPATPQVQAQPQRQTQGPTPTTTPNRPQTTLDVLRKRGQQARAGGSSTPQSSPSAAPPTRIVAPPVPPTPTPTPTRRAGAVIFNGREIRARPSAAGHRSSLLSAGEESGDEWEAV